MKNIKIKIKENRYREIKEKKIVVGKLNNTQHCIQSVKKLWWI